MLSLYVGDKPHIKKYYPWFAAAVLVLFGLERQGVLFDSAWNDGLPFLLLGLIAILAGALVTPVLLPFRSFALKGLLVGAAAVGLASLLPWIADSHDDALLRAATWTLFPTASSFIALQFTGSTTYTGMSGVKRELKIGTPLYIGAVAVSLLLLIAFKLNQ